MIPKAHRLSTGGFNRVFDSGAVYNTADFVFYIIQAQGEAKRKVVVPKSVVSTAVGRNKLRRKVAHLLSSEILKQNSIQKNDLLVVLKQSAKGRTEKKIVKQLQHIAHQTSLDIQ